MAWIYLLIAGLTEIIWAIGLKLSHGFTELLPSAVTMVFIVVSFLLFAKALELIPVGTAYAVFTGIGAAGTAVLGIVLFDENVNTGKIFFLCLLIVGIIGLKLVDSDDSSEEKVEL